jgi:hypothetical protein
MLPTHPPNQSKVAAAKAVMQKHYDWFMYIFLIHSANDTTATDAAFMNWMSYGALLDVCGVTDEGQRGCKQVGVSWFSFGVFCWLGGLSGGDV